MLERLLAVVAIIVAACGHAETRDRDGAATDTKPLLEGVYEGNVDDSDPLGMTWVFGRDGSAVATDGSSEIVRRGSYRQEDGHVIWISSTFSG